jgi:hypothetical protein
MGVLLALIHLSVVFSACTTWARAVRVAGPSGEKKRSLSWYSGNQHDICVSFAESAEQTLDIEHEPRVNGSGCSRQRVQDGAIVVDQWYGRVGNNLYQIAHAIFAAKLSGKLQVDVPLQVDWEESILELFNLPGRLDIHEDEEFRARVHCEEHEGSHFYLYNCNGVVRSDYTRVLRTYVLPHLIDGARGVCQREEANTKRELVIHLRTGDLLKPLSSDVRKGRMAPCSLLDKILTDPKLGSFERIRAITEPDRRHPCLEKFAANGVEVQSESLGADACAIMHAQHLVYFAKSTFSSGLSLFSPKPVTLYVPYICRQHGTFHGCPHDSGKAGRAIKYCIPDIETDDRSVNDKIDWILHCPSEAMWRNGVKCYD